MANTMHAMHSRPARKGARSARGVIGGTHRGKWVFNEINELPQHRGTSGEHLGGKLNPMKSMGSRTVGENITLGDRASLLSFLLARCPAEAPPGPAIIAIIDNCQRARREQRVHRRLKIFLSVAFIIRPPSHDFRRVI